MDMMQPHVELRGLLGEDLPVGGDDSETLFTNEEIQHYIDSTSSMERAAYEGWRVKAARLSNLVDTTEGNSQKKFSQLLSNAETMMKTYLRASEGSTEGRTRVGRARRPAMEW